MVSYFGRPARPSAGKNNIASIGAFVINCSTNGVNRPEAAADTGQTLHSPPATGPVERDVRPLYACEHKMRGEKRTEQLQEDSSRWDAAQCWYCGRRAASSK